MNNVPAKKYFTTNEIAELLGISRIAVFKKIQKGQIDAVKHGRSYRIRSKDIPAILGATLSNADKIRIQKSVTKTIKEYGKTLKMLGNE